MELGDGLKKLLLAGVGTVAVTAEKSKEILDELVKKGELTVEQGKVLNQELKHNIKETIKTKTTPAPKAPKEDIKDTLAKLSPEQLAELKEQILKMEAPKAEEEPKACLLYTSYSHTHQISIMIRKKIGVKWKRLKSKRKSIPTRMQGFRLL